MLQRYTFIPTKLLLLFSIPLLLMDNRQLHLVIILLLFYQQFLLFLPTYNKLPLTFTTIVPQIARQ